jgi:DNA polymerase-3 subunit alpha
MKREKIFLALKKYFNSINSEVINVCTVGTIKTKSAIRTAGRGLGIEDAVINYIVSLVPTERGVD